jgi:hypothetical protein
MASFHELWILSPQAFFQAPARRLAAMRRSTLVSVVALVVLSGIGKGDGRGAEPSVDGSEKTRTATRELFQTAGHLYRFERPVTLSSGAYRCLAEELGQFDDPQATEEARYILAGQSSWYGPHDSRPETKPVLALLDDDSSEVRLAAAIWLFIENDLWWIERLDPTLRDKLEGRLLATFREQLRHESQSLSCRVKSVTVGNRGWLPRGNQSMSSRR